MEYLFLLGRILLGGFFVTNGVNHFMKLSMMAGYAKSKGVPMAKEMTMLSGLMLIVGGLGIVFGVYIQFSVLLLAIFLVITTFQVHSYWKITDPMAQMGERVNFMKNIALLGALLTLLAIPLPWILSLHFF